jgi:hypothetical protein
MTNTQTDPENDGQIIPRRRGQIAEPGGSKCRTGRASPLKDVKNEGRSGNVYENKGSGDTLPDTKDDISARLHVILHKNTRILQKLMAFSSVFERYSSAEERSPRFKRWKLDLAEFAPN